KVLGILSNIDAQKKETIFATNLAMRDGLTGLYNRMATENLISQYVQNSTANGVMFIIDIDNFKSINDTMGHQFGDGVLVNTAKSLLTLFRSGDIIGRLGGDEFIVFMTNIGETYNVKRRAKDLITTISTPFQNKSDYPLDISGSVGVALFPQNGSNFDELYKNADIALYRSKSYGKNRYTLFDEKFLENYSQTGIITDIERNAALSKKENEIIGETDNIIYIRDASNHRMMYINDGAKLAYGLSDSDLGKPCYYAFHRRSSACDGCHIEKLKFDEFLVRESYNAELKKNFLVREKLIIWKGITAQILFATDITPQVTQRNEAILQNQLKQQLIETIEEISSSASLEEGIKRALNAMRQLYNGNGIILMSQPKPDNLSVEGTLSVLVDGKDFLFNFKQNVTEEFYQLISTCIKAHTETAVIDVPSFDCLSEQNLEFAHEHKITTALVYLSGLVSPGVIVAVLNPRANLKHLEIFEKVMRFIESQLQRQVLSEKVSAERKRYRTLISSISDSVFEYDVAEDD
ncbi:MAG: GGDEF domain-containing protein, partial [Oscillospiraceae bacterium]